MALRFIPGAARCRRRRVLKIALLLCLFPPCILLIFNEQSHPISSAKAVQVAYRAAASMDALTKTLTMSALPAQRKHGIDNPSAGSKLLEDLTNISSRVHDGISHTRSQLQGDTLTRENATHQECTFPDIDPFDPAVLALTVFHSPISCEKGVPHLVYVYDNIIKVNHSKTVLVGDENNEFKACRYTSIDRQPGSDFKTVSVYNSSWFNDSITLRDSDDNIVVECYGSNNTVLSRSYFSLIREKKDLEQQLKENLDKHIATVSPKEIFSVLMIGLDGNAKQNFERHMPKTRNYLLHAMNALELHKYNKAGDHTLENLMPLLTGTLEVSRRNWTWGDSFDYINEDMLWSQFRKAGYRTGLFFDDTNITAFHFHKKGFDKSPVDYYHRATVLELEKDQLMKGQGVQCVGDVPEITFNNNYWIQLASTFNNSKTQPYFGFSHSVHLTHDDHNRASAGDDLYLHFFLELKEKNLINNTIIIFFSDHGERIGKIRRTYNGMVETMTPYVLFIFPPWFHRKYPDLTRVLKINQDRLTTNRDIHATVLDILNFQGKPGIGDIKQPGISLFNEIPRERTCRDAGIPTEYCVCNKLTKGNVSAKIEFALVSALMRYINWLTDTVRSQCMELLIDAVEKVMEIQSDDLAQDRQFYMYLITISTKPSGAVYEAKYGVHKTTSKVLLRGEIQRLNLYRGQADCMNDPKLMPFCYCTNKHK